MGKIALWLLAFMPGCSASDTPKKSPQNDRTVLFNNRTLKASAIDTTATVRLHPRYRTNLELRLSNQDEPTVPAQCVIFIEPSLQFLKENERSIYFDGKRYRYGGAFVANYGKRAVTSFSLFIPSGLFALTLECGGNTAQDVLIRADLLQSFDTDAENKRFP